MLGRILEEVDSESAAALREGTLALHAGLTRGGDELNVALRKLRAIIDAALPSIRRWQPGADSLRRLMASVVAEGTANEYRDYAAAEQATMALQSLASSLHRTQGVNAAQLAQIEAALEGMLAATQDEVRFQPDAFSAALSAVGRVL